MIEIKINLFNAKMANSTKKFNQILNYYDLEFQDKILKYNLLNNKISFDDTAQNYFDWLSSENEFLTMKEKYLIQLEENKYTKSAGHSVNNLQKIKNFLNNITFDIINDILFNFFKNESIIDKSKIDINLNVPFLSENLYYNNKKVNLVKSTTGTGKTTSFLNYIKEEKKPFIFISSRVSLACDFYDKVKKNNIPVKIYNDKILNDKINENSESNLFYFNENIICQYDSIHKLENILEGNEGETEYIIYLDEINSLLNYICSSTTLKTRRSSCFYYFLNMLKMSKKIICTDNEITNITTSFFNQFCKKNNFNNPLIIWNDYKTWKNKDVQIYQNEQDFKNIISKKINDNIKINIISDSKSIIDIYKNDLEDKNKPWTIQTSDEKYIPVSEWSATTAYSPKITIGIDDQTPKEIFLIVQGRSVDCVDLFQMVCRARKLIKLHIIFLTKENKYKKSKYNNLNEVDNEIKEKAKTYNEILTNYNVVYYNNDQKFYNYDDSLFYCIYRQYIYINDMYNTSISQHFINILDREKFNIINNFENNKKLCKNKESKENIKEIKINEFDINDEKNIKLNKILKLTNNGIIENKELFIDKYKLNHHFNICILFYKNDINLGVLENNKNEFQFLKITQNRAKIHLNNQIMEILGLNSVYKINTFNQVNESKINIEELKTQYSSIYGKSKKIEKCKTVSQLFNILVANLNNLCGPIIKSKKKRNGTKLYYQHSIDEEALNYHFNLLSQRLNGNDTNINNNYKTDDPFIDT